jgi:hypothetical protein
MSMEDIKKTVFRTHEGMFGFMVRPFGRSYVPSKFQPMMNEILKPLLRRFVLVFFDDILIYNPSLSEHLRHVHLVLAKLYEHSLFIKKASVHSASDRSHTWGM